MSVLLIQPRYFPPDKQTVWAYKMPASALGYIAAVLRDNNIGVEVLDMEALEYDMNDLERYLEERKNKVKYIGIRMTIAIVYMADKIAKIARRIIPEAVIVIGGPQVFSCPAECLKQVAESQYALRGECEYTFTDFVKKMEAKGNVAEGEIEGLCIKYPDGRMYISDKIPLIQDLDKLPMPAYELLPMDKYYDIILARGKVSMMFTSRGCPYDCTFCTIPILYGYRVRDIKNVVDEMEYTEKELGIKQIAFHDDTFNASVARVEKLCDMIIERGLKISWRVKARIDHVTDNMLKKMKQAGCQTMLFGVESHDPERLKHISKRITVEKVRETFKLSRKNGIETLAFFMIGFPDQTRENLRKTVDFVIELDPDYVEFTLPVPYPDTALTKTYSEVISNTDWSDYYQWSSLFKNPYMSAEEVVKEYHRAYMKFYLRPKYVWRRIIKVRSLNDIMKNFKYLMFFLKKLVRKPKPEV